MRQNRFLCRFLPADAENMVKPEKQDTAIRTASTKLRTLMIFSSLIPPFCYSNFGVITLYIKMFRFTSGFWQVCKFFLVLVLNLLLCANIWCFYLTTVANNCIILMVIFIYLSVKREVLLWKTAKPWIKSLPCVKTEALFTQAPKFTAVLQTHGITVRSVLHLKTISKTHGFKKFVQQNKYNVGLDSAILMNPQTWVASGHLGGLIRLWIVRNVKNPSPCRQPY